jgi:hypothetical protein
MNPGKEPGATPFEKIANAFRRGETFTPDLIEALKATLSAMP